MTLYVGTSGWAYREWKPDFYPEDVPQKRFLEHYATRLSACEINATFRRMQSPETIARWRDATPEDFRFSTKAHQGLTHAKQLSPTDEKRPLFEAFIGSVKGLGDKLGVILWQYPPYRRRDDEDLRGLLDALRGGPPFALEFRHPSWDSDDVHATIAEAGGTVCLSETEGKVPEELPHGPLAYVRLRSERYEGPARAGWLDLLRKTAEERDVYAFTKHEGIPAADPFGGIGMAVWLRNGSR